MNRKNEPFAGMGKRSAAGAAVLALLMARECHERNAKVKQDKLRRR